MRTNIEIDDALMAEAIKRSGLRTKKAVVEQALRTYLRLQRQGDIRELFGKVEFHPGFDHKKLRRGRPIRRMP